ncbi:M56 family metallopeptidase [Phormidium sp. CLA17]|uniref:M56 family metallopeptidase n=1 Tax=Leptolyngbya sp. Cla-17 TaxID=2803751 RepID=UPI001491D11A|nr:M56 family metallopeptidase [Leptolyngbya sp. Cla-17]MBM0741475.1 M56 family metallopeptidase [Leptolyngbya sp. Cla-17]
MHFLMMMTGLSLAWLVRLRWADAPGLWAERWQRSLIVFLFSPLLLVITAIAILWMGPAGQMVLRWEGWLSYGLAIGFLIISSVLGLKLTWEGFCTLQTIRQNPVIDVNGSAARLLNLSTPYSARVGFWSPELVVSQGLIDTLDADHLEAVLVHEQAHATYHDTFWFFWLGWIRRATLWLPQTEALWQELLMLRELRADRIAAQQVDPLVLAESLLMVVSAPLVQADMQPEICAAFSWAISRDRLMERIDVLLAPEASNALNWWSFSWLLLACLPLVIIPFHAG